MIGTSAALAWLIASIVDQRTNPTPRRTGDHRIADPQGAVLDQHRRNRASTDVEVGLEDHADGTALGRRPQFLDLGDEEDLVE